MSHLLSLNKKYSELKRTIKITKNSTLESKLSNLRTMVSKKKGKLLVIDKEITNRQVELKKQMDLAKPKKQIALTNNKQTTSLTKKNNIKEAPSNPKFSPQYTQSVNVGKVIFDAEWDNVSFGDGFIHIKHNGRLYRKDLIQSKKYLNEIKHFYKFHNVPKLRVILYGSIVKAIENQEVLFYHIDFLTIAASNFGIILIKPFRLQDWKKYTKQFYKTNLSFVFHSYTLKRLCEYCDPNLPIIPVGEVVINSNGSKTIHNSFLFPIKAKTGHSIVWESIEESKASYVFSVTAFTDKEVQTLFDYIAGDTPQKRMTLINSKMLQNRLKMKCRILHTEFSAWDIGIRILCK